MQNSKLLSIALFLASLYILYLLAAPLNKILGFLANITYPFILSFILYYLTRPLYRSLKKKLGTFTSLLSVYALLSLFVFLLSFYLTPILITQFQNLQNINFTKIYSEEKKSFFSFLTPYEGQIREEAGFFIQEAISQLHNLIVSMISDVIGMVAEFFLMLALTPFILYYLLKDDESLYNYFISIIPASLKNYIKDLLDEADSILNNFFFGRILISLLVNALLLVAFMVVGLNYFMVLILISLVLYIIPSLGSALASILPLFVAFSQGGTLFIIVLAILGVATFLEGFWITPQIMKKKLYVHPVVLIVILLASGMLFGLLGVLFATPLYVLFRAFCKRTYKEYLNYSKSKSKC